MFCFWEIALANLIEERNVKSIYLLTKNSVNAKFGQKNNRPEPVVFFVCRWFRNFYCRRSILQSRKLRIERKIFLLLSMSHYSK